jgi:GAF domain-containing protein
MWDNLSNQLRRLGGFDVWAWMTAPTFEDDVDKTEAARTLNTFALIFLVALLVLAVGVLAAALVGLDLPGAGLDAGEWAFVGVLFLANLSALMLIRRGMVRLAGLELVVVIWLGFTVLILEDAHITNSVEITGYFLAVIIAAFVSGGRYLPALLGLSYLVMLLSYYLERTGPPLPNPSEFVELIVLMLTLGISTFFVGRTVDRIRRTSETSQANAAALQQANEELVANRDALTVQARRLERRNAHLDATMVVAQEALASVGDVEQLLRRVVAVISGEFDYYHTGIFWLDMAGEWVVLQAASSQGGQRMLAQGHRLRLGEGIVGYVARYGEPRIALDVGEDAVFFNNPDLPQTRSEMAAPLRSQGRVIGVLDVQSVERNAFSDEDAAVLQALADQISLAVTNARLLEESREAVEAAQRVYGEMTEDAWRHLLLSEAGIGFLSGENGTLPAMGPWRPEMAKAAQTGQLIEADDGTVVVPVKIGSRVVASIEVHLPSDDGGERQATWSPERLEMLQTLSAQLAQVLERARLYRETRRAAAQQRAIAEVGARIRSSLDMETMLRTAATEMRAALNLDDLVIRLAAEAPKTADAPETADAPQTGAGNREQPR